MRIGSSGSGVNRVGHDSKCNVVLLTDRRNFIPMDRSPYSQKLVNYGSLWQLDGRKFDGADDYVSCGNAASLTSPCLTMSLWLNRTGDGASTDEIFIHKESGSAPIGGWAFATTRASLTPYFRIRNSASATATVTATTKISNNWTYIVATYNGSSLKIYINGILEHNVSTTIVVGTTTMNIGIGATATGGVPFNGSIDEVRTMNIAQYAAKITRSTFRRKVGIGG